MGAAEPAEARDFVGGEARLRGEGLESSAVDANVDEADVGLLSAEPLVLVEVKAGHHGLRRHHGVVRLRRA